MFRPELKRKPSHPGEILREDFFSEYGLTAYKLAKELKVPRNRIEEIIREKRSITADTSLRLARFFGNKPEFWAGLQTTYDLHKAWNQCHEDIDSIAQTKQVQEVDIEAA